MPDFRSDLYRLYVTTFHGGEVPSEADLQGYWVSCETWFLPLLADLPRDAPILDLGCGYGPMTLYLERRGFTHVEGIDISEEQVRAAKDAGLNVTQADAFEFLPSHRDAYAAIIGIDVVEHFAREELLRLFPLLHQALRPDGRLILQTANGAGLFPGGNIYGDLTHLTIFTCDSLEQLLLLTGFCEIWFRETSPASRGIKGAIRRLLWGLVRRYANFIRKVEAGKHQDVWTENLICVCRKAKAAAPHVPCPDHPSEARP